MMTPLPKTNTGQYQNGPPTCGQCGDDKNCVVRAHDLLKELYSKAAVQPTFIWLSEGQITTIAHYFPGVIFQVLPAERY